MLCLTMVDVITSTDCCLYGSFCAVDIWYLSWSFKPPVSYSRITRHPTAWVLLHLSSGTGDGMTYMSACITSFNANLSSSWNSLRPPLTNSEQRHMHYRVQPICYRLHGSHFFFLFRLPKMNDRWWSHCMTGIAWSSRSSPEPTPSLSLWVEHSFGGYFFGFELGKRESPHFHIQQNHWGQVPTSVITQSPSRWVNQWHTVYWSQAKLVRGL